MKGSLVKRCDIVYCGGPGDVVATFGHWSLGKRDTSELSDTFSGQFFRVISSRGMNAKVFASHARSDYVESPGISVRHKPKLVLNKNGYSWVFADALYWFRVILEIARIRPRMALISDVENWWMLSLLSLLRVPVVVDLQCTLWPKGHKKTGLFHTIRFKMNGLYFRYFATAAICISPEIERQFIELSGRSEKVIPARPTYFKSDFPIVFPLATSPLRLFFAGRLVAGKGLQSFIESVRILKSEYGLTILAEIAGSGPVEADLRTMVAAYGLEDSILFLGQINKENMMAAYFRCHIVVVPTTPGFPEGLNRVVVEAVLAGRPVVATNICPANELFPESVLEVQADNNLPNNLAVGISTVALNYEYWMSQSSKNCWQFFDESMSWHSAVSQAIDLMRRQC